MDALMASRQDLAGLFTEEVVFEHLQPDDCMALLDRELAKRKVQAPFLRDARAPGYQDVLACFDTARNLASWANAHQVQAWAKHIAKRHFQVALDLNQAAGLGLPPLAPATALACMQLGLQTQGDRNTQANAVTTRSSSPPPQTVLDPFVRMAPDASSAPPPLTTRTDTRRADSGAGAVFRLVQRVDSIVSLPDDDDGPMSPRSSWRQSTRVEELPDDDYDVDDEDEEGELLSVPDSSSAGEGGDGDAVGGEAPGRRPGVPHPVWEGLDELKRKQDSERAARDSEMKRLQQESLAFRKRMARGLTEDELLLWKAVEDKIKRFRDEESKEKAIQTALKKHGPCVASFDWHREGSGWRCNGNVCFISDERLKAWL